MASEEASHQKKELRDPIIGSEIGTFIETESKTVVLRTGGRKLVRREPE